MRNLRPLLLALLVLWSGLVPQARAQEPQEPQEPGGPGRTRGEGTMESGDQHTAAAVSRALKAGRAMAPQEAERLELALRRRPAELEARVRLLGYYIRQELEDPGFRARRLEHALYLIEHRPEWRGHGPVTAPDPELDPEPFARALRLWRSAGQHPDANVDVLRNAARFLGRFDSDTALTLLARGERLEPTNWRWPYKQGELYETQMVDGEGTIDPELALRCLASHERALALAGPSHRSLPLEKAALAAVLAGRLERAEAHAMTLLGATKDDPGFLQGHYDTGVHHARLVLGLVALRRGDPERAESYLLAAGRSPGSPSLRSHGPNMLLARELLLEGRRQAVLQYLELCARFWQPETVADWVKEIRAGRMPEFGQLLSSGKPR